jgi:hypothetical protein
MQKGEGQRSEKEEGKRRRRDMCGGQARQKNERRKTGDKI